MQTPAAAQKADLSSWSHVTVDLHDAFDPGEWVLFDFDTSVIQVANSNPTFFHNNQVESSVVISGEMMVATSSDNDLIGLSFGYKDPGHCYILDWKKSAQEYLGFFRDEGLVIRKMHAEPDELTWDDYWQHENGAANYTILADNTGPGTGWQENTLYTYTVAFDYGVFTVTIFDGETVVWNVTVDDGDYTSGEFAFYGFTQPDVIYAAYIQNHPPICDPGGPYEGLPNKPIAFDGSASEDPDGEIVAWAWDFGDGQEGEGPTPSHVYTDIDVFTVTLCVTDDLGATSCCQTVADTNEPVPTVSRSWSGVKALYR